MVHASPRKVCHENKRKEKKKKQLSHKNFLLKGGLYQKTCWSNFDEIQVTDSTLNEDNNSLINE